MTRLEFINWFYVRFVLTKNDIYELGQLYDEVTKPHWISVEDELPPMRDENGTSDIVLTYTKGGGIYFNRYDYKGNTWGNPLAFNITYWMPLPQAPTIAKNATVKKGGEQ